eukprot:3703636-Lingulodinium_polyedra.AAC.1
MSVYSRPSAVSLPAVYGQFAFAVSFVVVAAVSNVCHWPVVGAVRPSWARAFCRWREIVIETRISWPQ